MHVSFTHDRSRAGQALVEMTVGLVALMLLLAGLLQIARLSLEHTRTMMAARELADRYAMDDHFNDPAQMPLYISDWQPGRDGVRYSQHDQPIGGAFQEIQLNVLDHARPHDLTARRGPNPIQRVDQSARVSDAFFLMRAEQRGERVPTLPLMRRLVTNDEWLQMDHTVWMPWTRGLDE